MEHLANESSCRFDSADSDFEAGENAFKVSLHGTVQQEIIHDLLTNSAKLVVVLFQDSLNADKIVKTLSPQNTYKLRYVLYIMIIYIVIQIKYYYKIHRLEVSKNS